MRRSARIVMALTVVASLAAPADAAPQPSGCSLALHWAGLGGRTVGSGWKECYYSASGPSLLTVVGLESSRLRSSASAFWYVDLYRDGELTWSAGARFHIIPSARVEQIPSQAGDYVHVTAGYNWPDSCLCFDPPYAAGGIALRAGDVSPSLL